MNDHQKKNEFVLLLILATILIAITGVFISRRADNPSSPALIANEDTLTTEQPAPTVTIQDPTLKTALSDLDNTNPDDLNSGLEQINNEANLF